MSITLTVIEGAHKGLEFSFAGHDTFLVGRSKHAHFQLPYKDKYFSRIHFMVEVNPPQCRLVDMGSHNGTYVNGARVLSADLSDGDQIRAGHTVLKLALHPTLSDGGVPHSATPQAAMRRQPVFELPGFAFDRELGRGPLGAVFLANRLVDQTEVALKVIAPSVTGSPEQITMFLREARGLRDLEHPYIVSCRDLGESGGFLYFVMDYFPAPDAGEILRTEGPLALPRAIRLASQLLEALEFAHAKGFVHRDIKPSNLLVTRGPDGEAAKLTDFGVARVYEASQLSGLTMTSDNGGTAAFMPPEQITNYRDVLPAADQYAVAATLYTLLTGKYVFDFPTESHRRFSVILQQTPIPIQTRRPDIPDDVAAAIHKALSRNPANRFADVGAFRIALTGGGFTLRA